MTPRLQFCGHRFPAGIYQQMSTVACASDAAAPVTGDWRPLATGKRNRVYTDALLATAINAYNRDLNVIHISGILNS